MIKIIKEGTRKIAKCPNCGCEFSYEKEDLCMDPIWKKWIVNCPQCNEAVTVMAERGQYLMDKDKIFVFGFDKSGETSDGSHSDFIASYEKVPGKARSLCLVVHRISVESDKICQI